MAGDWIPMRFDLATDPAVIQIAADLKLDEDTVVGKLHRFWCWCSQVSQDGHVGSVTKVWVDRYVRQVGFCKALKKAGWLDLRNGHISVPNWEHWMSESAKKRLVNSRRQKTYRRNAGVTKMSRSKRDKSVTTEEKRREESNTPPKPPKGGKVSKRQQRKNEEAEREELRCWYDGLHPAERRRLTEAATGSEHGCYDVGGVPLYRKMAQVRALFEKGTKA
jgi:hypothetical protein